MKIELLYFEGCPNHQPALERVKEVLKEQRISADVFQVDVHDPAIARSIGFLGSPSIRVNGLDVEPSARSVFEHGHPHGLTCRTYLVDGRREMVPSHEMLRQAIREAQSNPGVSLAARSRTAPLLVAGSMVTAFLASLCCVLPIVFALTEVSILGASAMFAAWRPYLLAATFLLLAPGFYFAYRPGTEQCASGEGCSQGTAKRTARWMLWLAAGAVILFAAFPYYSGPVAEFLLSHASRPAQPGE